LNSAGLSQSHGLVRRLDSTKPYDFAGDLVDSEKAIRWLVTLMVPVVICRRLG
jgi:hypothetical protein